MDQRFDQLYAAYFGNASFRWEEFTDAAMQYFDSNAGSPAAAEAYFNNFTIIWNSILQRGGSLERAERIWEQALQPALRWERANAGHRLHNGTPYYFWGMTSLLAGNVDQGYLLIHQAVEEDIRTSGQPVPNTPAFALVSLNYKEEHQAFRQWVLQQTSFFSDLIKNYNTIHRRSLTVDDVKQRFIDTPPNVETVFLLTYTVARLMKIAALPGHFTTNSFAGQLQLNLLFDLTLVIDAGIKRRNPAGKTFINHAEYLLAAVGHALTNRELRDVNGQFKRDFEGTLVAALDTMLVLQPRTALDRLQCDVALVYGLRNHGAHNVEAAPTVWKRFQALQEAVFRVFCATIDYLY